MMVAVPAIEMFLHFFVFVIVYRGLVTSLRVSAVTPWVYVLGTFAAIAGVGGALYKDLATLQEMPQVLNAMLASYTVSWIIVCLLIRQIGIRQDRSEREKRIRLEPRFEELKAL